MASLKVIVVLIGGGFLFVLFAIALAWFNDLLFSGNTNPFETPARQFASNEVLLIGGFGVVLMICGILYALFSRNSN
jgi:hypothetical protein